MDREFIKGSLSFVYTKHNLGCYLNLCLLGCSSFSTQMNNYYSLLQFKINFSLYDKIYYLTVSVILKSEHNLAGSFLTKLKWNCWHEKLWPPFSSEVWGPLVCWQNLVPCGCRAEFFIFLLAIRQNGSYLLDAALRYHLAMWPSHNMTDYFFKVRRTVLS